jgi:L-ascorbate metabolism protein UlaG (beta-lactamase superfamily)
MREQSWTATYIGGPTALLEGAGLRLLTDPALDPGGTDYRTDVYTLRKLTGPALPPEALLPIHAVLLSHDHHFDNLDHAGRRLLASAGHVLTTPLGAQRLGLGERALGLAPWQSVELPAPDGRTLRVTGTPCRHGPAGSDRGPVTGFVLAFADAPPERTIYLSGDTVWYDGVAEVAARFPGIRTAILFLGAARVAAVGPDHLTMTADEAVLAARAFGDATIVPLHYEGWEHFSESRTQIQSAFATAGLQARLKFLEPGVPTALP